MLVRWIIVLFGVCVGTCLTLENNSTTTLKNDTTSTLAPSDDDPEQSFKPKRGIDDFDFDASLFDDLPSIFPGEKVTGLTSFSDDEIEDISGFVPAPSFKVTRSNSESLGTHGQNYESPSSPSPNYQSGSQTSSQGNNPQQTNVFSNEDSQAIGQTHQNNAAYNNQATTPLYIDTYVAHPKYAAAKPNNAYTSETQYRAPAKVQYNPYPANMPVYTPIAQLSLHSIIPGNHHQVQQSASQNLPYKAPLIQNYKNMHPSAKVYAPVHTHNQQQQYDNQYQNHYQNTAPNLYENVQYTTTPRLDLNNKNIELPVLQLQTAQNYPGYVQALETTPLIFSSETGVQYKADPGFGLSYDFTKSKMGHPNQRSGVNSPFLGIASPLQVLPVQTASSAQFPKYKGASIAQYPSRGFSKIANDYQEFKSQPQLHFNGNPNNPKNYHPTFYLKPLEEIRTDVEVIDKKKPIPPLPKDDDDGDEENERGENESGEGFKKTDSYFPKNEDDDDDDEDEDTIPKYFKESEMEGEFKPSKSYPFDEYDGKFGKQKKANANDEDENEEDDDASVNLAAKYRYLAKSEDDDDGDDDDDDDERENVQEKRPTKHKSYSSHKRFQNGKANDDDEDEEESQKQVKREKVTDREQHAPKKSKHKDRNKTYSEEFEGFRRKQPKPKSSYRRSKSSKVPKEPNERPVYTSYSKSPKKTRHRSYRDESGEPSSRPSSLSGQPRQSYKRDYRSEESDKPKETTNSRTLPQVVWQDSYGLRISNPEDETARQSYSKEEAAVIDSYGNAVKSSTTSSPDLTTKSSHKNAGRPTQSDGNWKSTVQIKPVIIENYNKPPGPPIKALVNPKQNYYSPLLGRGEIFRSLKGI